MNEAVTQGTMNLLQYGILGIFTVILLATVIWLSTYIKKLILYIKKLNDTRNEEKVHFFEKLTSIGHASREALMNNTKVMERIETASEDQIKAQQRLHEDHIKIINALENLSKKK